MKGIKGIFLAAILLAGILGGTGCMDDNMNLSERMVNSLEQKYGESFTFSESYGGSMGTDSKSILCQSEQNPQEEICVRYSIDEDGNEIFSDNYLAVKYKEETMAKLSNMVSQVFGNEVVLLYDISKSALWENGTKDTTFEQYAANPDSYIVLTAIVSADNMENRVNLAEEFIRVVEESGVCCRIGDIYINGNDVKMDEFTAAKFSGYVNKKQYQARFSFTMIEAGAVVAANWR